MDEDIYKFVDELPHQLKNEISLYLHEENFNTMKFLKTQSMSYIAWICPLFKQYNIMDNEYLYFEGDEITAIYFLKTGNCGYVLPKFENAKYIDIQPGMDFGMEDIVGSIIKSEENIQDEWISHKDQLIRQFTVLGNNESSLLLMLSINDLHRMQLEFVESYEQLFLHSYKRLEGALKHKIESVNKCEAHEETPSRLIKK